MAFAYANPGSGPSAGGIGWFEFGNLTLNPGDNFKNLTGTLNDGTTVTFDISAPSNSSMTFNALGSPVAGVFGYVAYTGILGNVLLQNNRIGSLDPATIILSNIVVKDANGNPVNNYTTLISDAEDTNIGESWTFTTDGGNWDLFTTIGNNPTTLTGIGTQIATITGTTQLFTADYVLSTSGPKTITLKAITNGGLEAVAIGFATTRVTVQKNIGARINSADQFELNIAGNPNNQAFTTGINNGIQTQVATIYATPGNTYTINEAMANGSVSALTDYTITTSGVNLTPGGTTPPTGTLPINVTPVLGDEIVYTITNAAPETFTKKVDKSYADLGDILTYTVTGHNPNNFAVNNVLMTDATPVGTTYIPGSLIVSEPYSGTSPATGITILTVNPNSDATISWQVQVNPNNATSKVTNIASVNIPNQSSKNTNTVTTNINNADLTSNGNFNKTVDKTNATPGDVLTYTLTLHNTGNVAANNVVLTDTIPIGTTYVAGSITSTLPFTGDPTSVIMLTSPIAAGSTATITFKVKIGNTVPSINPIPNKAIVSYTYTVNPANPNGVTKTGISNTVNTNVVLAALETTKTVNQNVSYIGQVLTYNIALKNTGNASLNNVVITDTISNGTSYIPGSLTVSVPFVGTPASGIMITNSILPGSTVTASFQVTVISIPNPNPINNQVNVAYTYTLNPANPNGVSGISLSNVVSTLIFKNNYQQQINDLIESVALEETALAALINSEGAKIQAANAMSNISTQQLMCINKSVQDVLDSLNLLDNILKQKLNIVNCQINGCSCC
ncbi:MAG: hypothetical protein RR325_00300 [Bacilli bacterium]